MKLVVLLIVVVGGLLWLAMGRRKTPTDKPAKPDVAKSAAPGAPQAMLACAHCGVHLPSADALRDAAGHAYCTDAHRLAGPRSAG
ncbi:MAG: hypothetical protein RL227_1547 [Pseudomonadota bacterium]|jgi:uncharacterized protein